jgi:hypothetical protein
VLRDQILDLRAAGDPVRHAAARRRAQPAR